MVTLSRFTVLLQQTLGLFGNSFGLSPLGCLFGQSFGLSLLTSFSGQSFGLLFGRFLFGQSGGLGRSLFLGDSLGLSLDLVVRLVQLKRRGSKRDIKLQRKSFSNSVSENLLLDVACLPVILGGKCFGQRLIESGDLLYGCHVRD